MDSLDYTEYDTRLGAYAVVLDAAGQVLLSLWNEPETPLWTMPGGGVEFAETIEAGVVREVFEETGYEVEVVRLLGVDTQLTPGPQRLPTPSHRELKAVRVVYEARVIGGSLVHEADGTTDEARWHALEEVASLPHIQLVDAALGLIGLDTSGWGGVVP